MEPSALGKYEVRGVLGRGAAGTVYEAWDPVIYRKVAIKTVRLPPPTEAQDELARFRREAQAAGRLSHPGIVAAYDYGETEELAYIVMEFVDGRTLKSVLEAQERLPLPAVLRVMDDVLAALEYSHGRGVVHRDIKPANVILTAEGRAKVADFGIARIESSNLTQAGTVMGTPAYMSPEQFMGQVVDRRTDIYACGVLLYQLLAGERPFEGGLTAIMHKALNTVPPRPSELAVTAPPALDAVVARAMAKRPEDRYGGAAEFARAIHDAVPAAAPSPAPAPAPAARVTRDDTVVSRLPPRPAPARGTRAGWLALGGVGLTAVLGSVAWLLFAPGPKPPVSDPAPEAAVSPPTAPSLASGDAAAGDAPPPEASAPPRAAPSGVAPASAPNTAKLLPGTLDPPPTSPPPDARQESVARPPPRSRLDPPAPPDPAPPADVQPQSAPSQSAPSQSAPPRGEPPPRPPEAPTDHASRTRPWTAPPESSPVPAPDARPGPQAALVRPPAPPEPAPTPSPDPRDGSRAAVAAALDSIPCALLGGDLSEPGELRLTGLARKDAEPAIRAAVARAAPGHRVAWTVVPFEGAGLCPALDVLRPVAGRFGAPNGLTVGTADGRTFYRDGDIIVMPVQMPGFPAWLWVDYLSGTGTVDRLHPGAGTRAPHPLPAGARVRVGDEAQGFSPLEIQPPFGTDLVIFLASAAPLHDGPRPDRTPAAAYLRELRAALDAARRDANPVAAAALVLVTSPAPAPPPPVPARR